MKVVPKHTIIDRIREDLAATIRGRRTPDYVVVTEEEYRELRDDPRVWQCLQPSWSYSADIKPDATVDTKRFEHKSPRTRTQTYMHAIAHDKFEGVPLYVVPAEYHP